MKILKLKRKKIKKYDKFKNKDIIIHEENPYNEYIKNNFKIKYNKK